MSNDFDEFCEIVGKEVSTYRICPDCTEIAIVNPDTYDKPKCECDPGYCPYHIPICLCTGGNSLYSLEQVEECNYPDCDHGNGVQTG